MTSIHHHLRRGALPGSLLLLLGVASGCPSPDAEGKYERFNEQTEDDREVPEPKMDMGTPVLPDFGGSGGETEGEYIPLDGVYLVPIDTNVSPGLPLQFLGEVTAEVDLMGNGTISVEFQPLSLSQGSTSEPREEVGDALLIEADVANFAFTLEFGETMVTGAANPLTGSDILADIALEGSIKGEHSWCGNVTGMVLSPIMVDLVPGSFFAATLLADRSERPLDFPCKCDTIGGEPGSTGGCFPAP